MNNLEKQREFFNIVEPYLDSELVQNMKSLKGHSGVIDRYEHSISVAYKSFKISKKLGLDIHATAIGGLLHDIGIYNDITNIAEKALDVIKHPKYSEHLAMKNYDITKKQANIIKSHMWPVCLFTLPKSMEAVIVNAVDKYCATAEYLRLYKVVKLHKHPALSAT